MPLSERFPCYVSVLALLVIGACTTAPPPIEAPIEPVATPRPSPAAQVPDPGPTDLSEVLRLDPAVRSGQLDNGLRWYVRQHGEPQDRVELRLVVAAGSVEEDADQRGLAHVVEHMAFNGTERFDETELVTALESMGMRFGADLNASTGFDRTLYRLQVPTDDLETLELGLDVLAEWASRIRFSEDAVERERGVVLEEWRLGRGAEARIFDQQAPVLFAGSRYAERLPIGTRESLESFDAEALRRFYDDWYRPGLMTVIAVGDGDPEWLERAIRQRFAAIPARQTAREPHDDPVEPPAGIRTSVVTDPEATSTRVSLTRLLPPTVLQTVGEYRRSIVRGLAIRMLGDRFDELARRPDPPFVFAFATVGRMVRGAEAATVTAVVATGEATGAVEVLASEVERVRRHGFTNSELDRASRNALRAIESAWAGRATRSSASYAAEYIRHTLNDEAAPGLDRELELHRELLPTITLDEVSAVADLWAGDGMAVLVSAPETEESSVPDDDELRQAVAAARARQLEPWDDAFEAKALLEAPRSGTVVSTEVREDLGLTRWTLSNGVEVWFKPTDFKDDEVLLFAFSPGGTSLADLEQLVPAETAATVLREGGLGEHSRVELDKLLAGRVAAVNPFISELEEGLTGSASPRDLETLLQLVHLTMTAPRPDPDAFQSVQQRWRTLVENRLASPDTIFADEVSRILSNDHPRRQPWTLERVEAMDLPASAAFYRERFADASDFTFVFVGAVTAAELEPLVTTYLASLPAGDREESWRDVGVERPEGPLDRRFRLGLEEQGQARILLLEATEWSERTEMLVDVLVEALSIRLREVIREELGATYGVRVSGGVSRRPRERSTVSIAFGCDPERVDELVDLVLGELEAVRDDGVDPDIVDRVVEQVRRQHELALRDNRFWRSILVHGARWDEDPAELVDLESRLEWVTPTTLQETAARVLDLDARLVFTRVPAGE